MKKFLTLLILTAFFAMPMIAETTAIAYVEKGIATRYGVEAQVWFISSIQINTHPSSPSANIRLSGYASTDAYQAGNRSIGSINVSIKNTKDLAIEIPKSGTKSLYELVASKAFELILADSKFAGGVAKVYNYTIPEKD